MSKSTGTESRLLVARGRGRVAQCPAALVNDENILELDDVDGCATSRMCHVPLYCTPTLRSYLSETSQVCTLSFLIHPVLLLAKGFEKHDLGEYLSLQQNVLKAFPDLGTMSCGPPGGLMPGGVRQQALD